MSDPTGRGRRPIRPAIPPRPGRDSEPIDDRPTDRSADRPADTRRFDGRTGLPRRESGRGLGRDPLRDGGRRERPEVPDRRGSTPNAGRAGATARFDGRPAAPEPAAEPVMAPSDPDAARRETIGKALIGLVVVLCVAVAVVIALPAWADIGADDPTTTPAVAVAATGTVAASDGAPAVVRPSVRARPTATDEPTGAAGAATPDDEDTPEPSGREPTPTPEIDATLRPAPPVVALDDSGGATVIDSGPAYRQEVALTVDLDGADPDDVEALLDGLADQGVVISFGITGEWAEDNDALTQRIVGEGHMLIDLTTGTDGGVEELGPTGAALIEIAGYDPRPFWRPATDDPTEDTLIDAAGAGYGITILWNVTSPADGDEVAATDVADEVVAAVEPGGIVRLRASEAADLDAIPDIVDTLVADGYGFVTVEQLLRP